MQGRLFFYDFTPITILQNFHKSGIIYLNFFDFSVIIDAIWLHKFLVGVEATSAT